MSEKKLEDMTDDEKEEWAVNFLEKKGYGEWGRTKKEVSKEDALNKAWTGGTKKKGSHREGKHK